MPTEEHFRRLERMYATAPINEYFAPKLLVAQGVAEVTIPLDTKFHHAAQAVHGAVYFKALDDAAWFAVASVIEHFVVLTASFNVHLLRPIGHGEMTARGRVVHGSRRLYIAEAELRDRGGRPLARGSGTFMPGNTPLSADVGYE